MFLPPIVRLELEDLKASLRAGGDSEEPQPSPPTDRRLSLAGMVSSAGSENKNLNRQRNDRHLKLSLQELSLHKDPRSWSREDVSTWLVETVRRNSLPFVSPQSFKMNGKGLSMLTMEMFSARAPCGGKTLFKDFQIRLTEAIYDVSRNNYGQENNED